MSQAKVDYHKKEKANRKSTVKKAKIQGIVATVVAVIVAVGVLAWVVYSSVIKIQEYNLANKNWETYEASLAPISDYMAELNAQLNPTEAAAEAQAQ